MNASPLILLLIVSAVLFIGYLINSIRKKKKKQAMWGTLSYILLIGLGKLLYHTLGIYYAIIIPVLILVVLLFVTDPTRKKKNNFDALDS